MKNRIFTYSLCVIASILYFLVMFANASKVSIDSDFANLVLEAWDFIQGDFFLRDRQFTGITFFTTDFPYFVLGTLIFGLSPLSYVFAVALMILGIGISGAFLLKVKNRKYPFFIVPVYVAFSLFPGEQGISFLRSHTGAAVLSFFALYFVDRFFRNNNKKELLFAGILFLLSLLGDMSSFVIFIAPLLVIYGYKIIRSCLSGEGNESRGTYWKIIMYCVAVFVCSFILDKAYFLISGSSKNSFFEDQKFLCISEYGEHLNFYWTALFSMFGGDFFGKPLFWGRTFFYFFKSVYLVTGLIFIIKSSIESFTKKNFDIISSVLSLGFVFISVIFIFTSISKGISTARYFCFAPVLFGVVIARQLQFIDFSKADSKFIRICRISFAVLSLVVVINCLRKVDYGFFVSSEKRYEACYDKKSMKLIKFLEENNLSCGYSDFWHASSICLLSKNKVRIRAVLSLESNRGITRHNWFCKNSWYEEPGNFILITENAKLFGLTDDIVRKNYGEPANILKIEDYQIFVYDHPVVPYKNFEESYNFPTKM